MQLCHEPLTSSSAGALADHGTLHEHANGSFCSALYFWLLSHSVSRDGQRCIAMSCAKLMPMTAVETNTIGQPTLCSSSQCNVHVTTTSRLKVPSQIQKERFENRTQLSNCFEGANQHTAHVIYRQETTPKENFHIARL
jgi:hypothetical protein